MSTVPRNLRRRARPGVLSAGGPAVQGDSEAVWARHPRRKGASPPRSVGGIASGCATTRADHGPIAAAASRIKA